MIGGTTIIAIEGTHGTGKTTLTYALASELTANGHPTKVVSEVVRRSPWFQEALRSDGMVEPHALLHLFADQLRLEIAATMHETTHVILDRTVFSCLGYWVLRSKEPEESMTLRACRSVAHVHGKHYDHVVYCGDRYPLAEMHDPLRDKDEAFRERADNEIRAAIDLGNVMRSDLPTGLIVARKVKWVTDMLRAGDHYVDA